jgi:hypothetical protein
MTVRNLLAHVSFHRALFKNMPPPSLAWWVPGRFPHGIRCGPLFPSLSMTPTHLISNMSGLEQRPIVNVHLHSWFGKLHETQHSPLILPSMILFSLLSVGLCPCRALEAGVQTALCPDLHHWVHPEPLFIHPVGLPDTSHRPRWLVLWPLQGSLLLT